MNNIEEIIENLISYKGTLTILVGAGASTEGIKENGEKIPSYTEIKEDILNRYGYHNLTKDELENKFDEFLNKYEKDIQNECETKLVGHPNSVHIEFLSFCLARVRERNGYSTIILTTNYDDLLEDAHKAVCMNDESIKSISFTRDDNHTENIAKIKEQLNNNKVVIAHLWGDLSYVEAVFRSEKMSFQESVKEFLTDIFLNPILSIGYSFQDKPLFEFIDQSTKNPVYVMSKKNRTNHFLNREYITLGYYFSEFMKETFSHINNNNPIKEKYLKYISNHQEFRLYAEEENLLQKLKNINNSALSNLESKIPDGGMDTLIERISVNNSYNDFLKNDSKIFALVGEAGMGKSTYIYYNTMKRYECSSFLTLTIEPESFDNNNSLLEYLSKKFTFKPYLKDTWFSALNAYLELNNLNLLIQIDAINEFTTITPSNLKKEIENLALDGVLRDRIKILFSCREIYWNQMEHNSSNITKFYHHSKIFKIEKYNKEEAPLAFKSYKRAYNLLGEWESLDEHFKEHLSDPLLMNLMARAYNNDTIPKYAPAFSIFKMYLEKLPKKFMFERILKSLGSRFLKQTMGYNTSKKQFSFDESLVSLFPQKDQEKTFYDILYDERIINKTSSHNDRYSFTYDRFFEYILGLSIIELYELDEGFDTSKIVNILNESKGEFHLIQGLKSALVNISCNYIDSPNRSSLLTDISRLRELLNIENNDVKLLIKDTLQEILVENGGEGFDFIEEAFNDKEQFLEFIVEYCSDNLHAVSFLIETILSGNKKWYEKSRYGIYLNFLTPSRRGKLLSKFESYFAKNSSITSEQLVGLIFVLSIYFDKSIKLDGDIGKNILYTLNRVINSSTNKINFENNLINSFILSIKNYADNFFSLDANHNHLEYLWKMSDDVENYAKQLRNMYKKVCNKDELNNSEIEILRFFCSDVKEPADMTKSNPTLYSYRIEHILARYCILKSAYFDSEVGMGILRHFIKSNFYFSIDAALCLAQRIAIFKLDKNDRDGCQKILNEMEEWMYYFEETQPENFFLTLSCENPLNETYNPMNQVAMIEGLLYNYDNEIPIFSKGIKNVMEAKELKKVPKAIDVKYTKLNFLSIRKMIRIFPDASLKAILEVLKIKDENIIPEYWIKETLARMAQIYPKKVKFVLNKEKYYDLYVEIDKLANKLDLDISGQEWDHDEIAKYFLLNDSCKHLELFFNWYEKIFKTYDFDTYFEEMAREILRVTKGE